MSSVIFLDIDGVLNSKFWDDEHQKEISDGKLVDVDKIRLLATLVKETEAKIILHSGWRFWFDQDLKPLRHEAQYFADVMAKEGLKVDGTTPDLTTEEIRRTKKFSLVKADEILKWLDDNSSFTKWVVLDDLDLHNEEVARHQVKTDPEVGLTEKDLERAFEILG